MSGSDIVRDFYSGYFAEKMRGAELRANVELIESFSRRANAESPRPKINIEQFEAALRKLDADDQQIITMRNVKRMSNKETAAALGLDEPSASMRYLHAMNRLQKMLSGE